MNFGAFAGGFSQGMERGARIGKELREIIKEKKLQDLREQGMAEAEAQRSSSVQSMIKEGGVSGQPTSGPVDISTPKVETPPVDAASVSAASPTANPDAASANTASPTYTQPAPSTVSANAPTANPDPAGAATAAAAQPTGAPAAQPVVQATPQAMAATGVAAPVQKPNGKFTVNGQSFDTREQALAAAEKSAPSATDLFMKNTVPKISQSYIEQGDPEKALAWDKYAKSHNGERAMKDWAAAFTAPDLDTAADKFGKYYTDHINDGVDYTGHKMLTKDDGTQVAVVTLKDKATGKSTEMEITREKMLALGGANNPQKLFEQEVAKQQAADKMKFEAKLKAQERREKNADAMSLEDYKQNRLDSREGMKGKQKIDEIALREELSAEYADRYKKATSPGERAAIIDSDLTKNDPRYARMSKDEQKQKVLEKMKNLDEIAAEVDKSQKPAAKVDSKPMAFDAKLPVKYNKADGKPYHLMPDGRYVPIEGGVVPKSPAAGGLPVK